jgi:hypothetical protein
LIAGVYRKQIDTLAGKGVLFVVADEAKILAPPTIIAEVADGFPSWRGVK